MLVIYSLNCLDMDIELVEKLGLRADYEHYLDNPRSPKSKRLKVN